MRLIAQSTTTQQVAGSNPAIPTSPRQEARGERAPPLTAIFIQSTVKNECDSAEETADGSERDEQVRTREGRPATLQNTKRKEVRALRFCNDWMGWYDSIKGMVNFMCELYGLARFGASRLCCIEDKAARSSAGAQMDGTASRNKDRMRFHTAASGE